MSCSACTRASDDPFILDAEGRADRCAHSYKAKLSGGLMFYLRADADQPRRERVCRLSGMNRKCSAPSGHFW
jgi:hypothetical protein